jgi:hypothetical protein
MFTQLESWLMQVLRAALLQTSKKTDRQAVVLPFYSWSCQNKVLQSVRPDANWGLELSDKISEHLLASKPDTPYAAYRSPVLDEF